ncbi:MAG: hypothetical protein Q9226_007365 [Calogaya cf. arnoldii]
MRCQLFFLAALSLECAIAQPAHHRHHHKVRRTWQDVDFKHKTDYDMAGVDFDKAYAEGQAKAAAGAGAPAPSSAGNSVTVPKAIDVIPVPAESDKKESDKKELHKEESHKEESPKDDSDKEESKHNKGAFKSPDGQSSDNSSGTSDDTSGVIGGAKGSFGGIRPGFVGATNDGYHGNVGIPYGSNMMAINTGDTDKYKYTNTFKNTGSNPITIQIWNKEGRDGDAQSGQGQDPNIKFTLQAGQSQAIAFDENTNAAFSRDCKRDKENGNIAKCVWGELSFGSEMPAIGQYGSSKKWSGFNRSSIIGGANEVLTMTCTSCGEKARDETMSGKGQNTWETAGDPFHRNGVPPGPAHLLTEMAF